MFRSTFDLARCVVAPRLFLAASHRLPSVMRAGIQYSRLPSSVKSRTDTGNSSAIKITSLNSATDVPVLWRHSTETSNAPSATSNSSLQVGQSAPAVGSVSTSARESASTRARCPRGIIRCACVVFLSSADISLSSAQPRNVALAVLFLISLFRQKHWLSMDSETRYHWRCLGWGPELWENGPNPPSTSSCTRFPRRPPFSYYHARQATPRHGGS